MSHLGQRLAREIDRFHARLGDAPVHVSASASEITARIEALGLEEAVDTERLLDEVASMLFEWTEHARSPRHFGLTRPNVDELSIFADALVALFDPNLATWEFAPAANEIERYTLHELARLMGWDGLTAATHFTSGGQEANHTAVVVALTHGFPGLARRGLRGLEAQPVMYLSEEGHHSFEKAAHATGLGRDALHFVSVVPPAAPAGVPWTMDPNALERRIAEDKARGLAPFLVLGTAGATSSGVVDPLDRLGDVARREGLWLHVDAAWGGPACLSAELRPLFAGIERADSVTCDAHKLLSVPVGAGMFFCRHVAPVHEAFGVDAAYAPPLAGDRPAPFTTSLQWSRRFIGLKVFLMLAGRGAAEVTARIERQAALARSLRGRLTEAGWSLVNDTPLPTVCFTHAQLAGPAQHQRVVDHVKTRGLAWISATRLAGSTPALRASVTNYETGEEDLERLVAALGDALGAGS